MMQLDINRVGAVTPLGLSAPTTCAAFRAGIKVLKDVYFPVFPQRAVVGATVPVSRQLKATREDWIVNLACRALAEAMDGVAKPQEVALLLAVPVPQAGDCAAEDLADRIQRRLRLDFRVVETFVEGAADAIIALHRARTLLTSGEVRFCCVGGVDSMVNGKAIEALRKRRALKSEERPMGVMPAEGAGFFLVSACGTVRDPMAVVLGVAHSRIDNAPQARARSMQAAFEGSIHDARIDESEVSFTVTDHNGERRRALDFMVSEMRTFRTRRESMPHWTLHGAMGDSGAAAGALAVVLAATSYHRGYAPGPVGLCAASKEGQRYAACIVRDASPRWPLRNTAVSRD